MKINNTKGLPGTGLDIIVGKNSEFPDKKFKNKLYLNFISKPGKKDGIVQRTEIGYRQDFYVNDIISSLNPGSIAQEWSINLFLTSVAVARAETLGSAYVYIPESFFKSVARKSFYTFLNELVDVGTSAQTKIEVKTWKDNYNSSAFEKRHVEDDISLILSSGGTDSTIAGYLVKDQKRDISFLQVLYGQAPRFQEEWCVDRLFEDMDVKKLHRTDINILKKFGGSALLVDDFRFNDDNLSLEYVPFRNTIFASLGLVLCDTDCYNSVVLGAHPDDTMAPDGRLVYINKFNELLSMMDIPDITVDAPLFELGGKPELIDFGLKSGVRFDHTWSCHGYVDPRDVGNDAQACGKCGNCITRYSAFNLLGKEDPLKYKAEPNLRTSWAGPGDQYQSLTEKLAE